jgi:hypothetical protein
MPGDPVQVEVIQMLLARLARISADSPWAYKASGLRGSLMRCLDELEAGHPPAPGRLNTFIAYGFTILENVAQSTAPGSEAGRQPQPPRL